MPSFLRVVGLALFAVLGVFFVAFGTLYASVNDMLWFHAAATPEASRAAVLPLYLALMDLIGSASIGLGLLSLYVVFGPIRRGSFAAAWALSLSFAAPLVGAGLVAERLAAVTGAPTSWHIMGALLALTAAALFCATRRPARPAHLAENRAMEARGLRVGDRGH